MITPESASPILEKIEGFENPNECHPAVDVTLETNRPLVPIVDDQARNANTTANEPRLRICIVKWDRFFAESIKLLAIDAFPSCSVEIFQTGGAALAAFRTRPPDLAVFGLTLPDWDGLDMLPVVIGNKLARKCLIVSGRRDERTLSLLRDLGAHGYVDTEAGGVEVLRFALREIGQGGTYFSPPARRQSDPAEMLPTLDRHLSPTELQVLAIIGDGSDDQQASDRLCMAVGTVHKHRQHIMHKLGVQTRTDLMRVAIQRGIVRIVTDRVLRPGFERQLEERARSRDPFAKRTKVRSQD